MAKKRFVVEMDETIAAILKNSGQMRILSESKRDWGYWITENGDVITVDDHDEYARGTVGNDFEDEDEDDDEFSGAVRTALSRGWIKITCPGSSFAAVFTNADAKSRQSLYRLIKRSDMFNDYYINSHQFFDQISAANGALKVEGMDL